MSAGEAAVPARPARSVLRPIMFGATLVTVLGLLFGLPWWTLIMAAGWSPAVTVAGTILFVIAVMLLPVTMILGHGRRIDWASRIGDTLLGVMWVLFTWSLLGNVLRLALDDPKAIAVGVAAVSSVLIVWGYYEAMRVPRVRRVDVVIPRLGRGLDGLKVVQLTDTHYGPIDRAKWSRGVTEAVNRLEPDIVCHTGDIADGTAQQRAAQSAPLADIRAAMARVYVTGNHEYYGETQGWLDRMQQLGWDALRNRHTVIERGGDRLVLAGVDDATAAHSGRQGHRADLATALSGADPELPVLLLAHQPKQIGDAVEHGVDLQLSGHTHGGQIWPFNFFVMLDQPSVNGLTQHGERTQLYTSNGTGFWGPPLRVFAPSEITLITLRSAA